MTPLSTREDIRAELRMSGFLLSCVIGNCKDLLRSISNWLTVGVGLKLDICWVCWKVSTWLFVALVRMNLEGWTILEDRLCIQLTLFTLLFVVKRTGAEMAELSIEAVEAAVEAVWAGEARIIGENSSFPFPKAACPGGVEAADWGWNAERNIFRNFVKWNSPFLLNIWCSQCFIKRKIRHERPLRPQNFLESPRFNDQRC